MDADDDGRITKSEFLNHSLMKMNQKDIPLLKKKNYTKKLNHYYK